MVRTYAHRVLCCTLVLATAARVPSRTTGEICRNLAPDNTGQPSNGAALPRKSRCSRPTASSAGGGVMAIPSQTMARVVQVTDQGAGGADEVGATVNKRHGQLWPRGAGASTVQRGGCDPRSGGRQRCQAAAADQEDDRVLAAAGGGALGGGTRPRQLSACLPAFFMMTSALTALCAQSVAARRRAWRDIRGGDAAKGRPESCRASTYQPAGCEVEPPCRASSTAGRRRCEDLFTPTTWKITLGHIVRKQ